MGHTPATLTLIALLAAGASAPALAQCPDGSPPPCGPRLSVDSSLIVILPFRVRADSSLGYLREGLAEVLPVEFTGEGVPRAVDPGIVLRAWQRAGGRRDLTRAAELRLAEQLGAGRLLIGAVIGSRSHIVVTASIVSTPDGTTRVGPVQLEGSPDSLPVLVAGLMARLSPHGRTAWRMNATDPGTASSEAWRAFMTGMARSRDGHGGVESWARALTLDSSFVLAAYWLAISPALAVPVPEADRVTATRLAWSQRHRLSRDQRVLLEAVFGPGGPDSSYSAAVQLALLEHAVATLPRSYEAWHMLGDRYFHMGALLGYQDWVARSVRAFERALALDSGAGPILHLTILAVETGDTVMHRRYIDAINRRFAESPMGIWERYRAAVLWRSPTLPHDRGRLVAIGGLSGYPWVVGVILPYDEQETLLRDLERRATTPGARRRIASLVTAAASNAGQPARAAAARRAYFGEDSVRSDVDLLKRAEADSDALERLERVLSVLPDTARWNARCEVVLARLRRDDTTSAAEHVRKLRLVTAARSRNCATVAEAIAWSRRADADLSMLRRIDTMLLDMDEPVSRFWNYDIALAYARRGQWSTAAAAVKRRMLATMMESGAPEGHRLALALRDEGRWSALAGDTTGALRAFRQYLRLRERPEPVFVPERDSIRAELGRLESRRR